MSKSTVLFLLCFGIQLIDAIFQNKAKNNGLRQARNLGGNGYLLPAKTKNDTMLKHIYKKKLSIASEFWNPNKPFKI